MRDATSSGSLRVEAFDGDCDFVGFTSLIVDPSDRLLFESVGDKLHEKGRALRPRRGDCYAAFLNSALYDRVVNIPEELAPWVPVRLPDRVPQTLLPPGFDQTTDDGMKRSGAYSPRRISKLAKLQPSLFFPNASVVVAMDFKLTLTVDLHDLADYALRHHVGAQEDAEVTTVHFAAFQHICVADFPRGGLGNNSLPCDPSMSFTAANWMVKEAELVNASKRTDDGDALISQARRYAESITPMSSTFAETALVFWRITSQGDAIAKLWLEEFLRNSDRDQPALCYVLNNLPLDEARGVRLLPPALPACDSAPIPACDPSLHRVQVEYAAGTIEELVFGEEKTEGENHTLSLACGTIVALVLIAFHFKLIDTRAMRSFLAKEKKAHVK